MQSGGRGGGAPSFRFADMVAIGIRRCGAQDIATMNRWIILHRPEELEQKEKYMRVNVRNQ